MLVIGGGEEAEDKVDKLLRAQARITLVAPQATAGLRRSAERRRISWFARPFHEHDVAGAQLVLLSEPDQALALKLKQLKTRHGFWICALDLPDCSDVFLVSTLMRGPVQVGISTGGGAPLLARRMRKALEAGLDAEFVEFARMLARERAALRDVPKAERTARLARLLSGFAMDVRVSYSEPEGEALVPRSERPERR